MSFLFLVFGCGTSRISEDAYFNQLARASIRLGFDIRETDNHALLLLCSDLLGTPYRYGGKSRAGMDCSGFTYYVYKELYGISLTPNSAAQYERNTYPITTKELRQGDLLFFITSGTVCNHVGIYLTGNKFIHASTSSGVIVSELTESYWRNKWIGMGRVRK